MEAIGSHLIMINNRQTPRVTVIIPTYNRPDFLEGAIKTALGQTYENLEVIVIDDGSSEQYAREIVSNFPSNVIWIRHEENKGLSAARNTGIREAEGDFVAFLDDDDRWHKTKIARQVAALEENREAGLATCLVAAITPDSEIIHCETNAPSGDCSEELLVGNKIGTPSRVLVRRECFDDVGTFDESLPTKQDWDFYLRLCQKWKIVAVEDHLCFRTVHESMSSSPVAVERDKQAILNKHENLIRSYGYWNQARTAILEEVGRSYLGQGELKMARTYLKESLQQLTKRRLILYLLTLTTPQFVNWTINLKRRLIARSSACEGVHVSSSEIPGLSY